MQSSGTHVILLFITCNVTDMQLYLDNASFVQTFSFTKRSDHEKFEAKILRFLLVFYDTSGLEDIHSTVSKRVLLSWFCLAHWSSRSFAMMYSY